MTPKQQIEKSAISLKHTVTKAIEDFNKETQGFHAEIHTERNTIKSGETIIRDTTEVNITVNV